MDTIIGNGVINIIAKTDKLQKNLNSLSGSLAQKFGSMGDKLTKNITLPFVAAAGSVFALTKKVADCGDSVAKTAQKAGLSIKGWQELEYALGQNGVQANVSAKALTQLTQKIGQAAAGNKQFAGTFKDINLTDTNGKMRTTEAVFVDVIGKINRMDNAQMKAAAAAELFGSKVGKELMPAINGGKEGLEELIKKANDMGLIMSDEAAQASEKFGDSLDDLKRRFAALGREIGTKLIPIFNEKIFPMLMEKGIPAIKKIIDKIVKLIDWFSNLSATTKKFIGIGVKIAVLAGPILKITSLVMGVGQKVSAVFKLFKLVKLAPLLANPVVLAIVGVAAALFVIIKNWEKIKKYFSKVKKRVKNIFSGFNKFLKSNAGIIVSLMFPVVGIPLQIAANWDKIKAAVGKAMEKIKESFQNFKEKMIDFKEKIIAPFKALIGFLDGIKEKISGIISKLDIFGLFGKKKANININASGGSGGEGRNTTNNNNNITINNKIEKNYDADKANAKLLNSIKRSNF